MGITEELQAALKSRRFLTTKRWNGTQQKQVNNSLSSLFKDVTSQQLLYDTTEIKRLIPYLHVVLNSGMELTPESNLVARKLAAHAAYSDVNLWNASVRLFDQLQKDAEEKIGERHGRWYRIFSLDHAISRLYGTSKSVLDKRQVLISQFKELIEDIDNPNDDLRLRVAHYHGHQGNYFLRSLQDLQFTGCDVDGMKTKVGKLVNQATLHFVSAINLRVNKSEEGFFWNNDFGENVKDLFPVKNDGRLERWGSLEQAIADTANQFSCLVCVACYQFLVDSRAMESVKKYAKCAKVLWDALRREIAMNQKAAPYRVIDRRRISEHMLHLLSVHSKPKPKIVYGVEPARYSKPIEGWDHDTLENFTNGLRFFK